MKRILIVANVSSFLYKFERGDVRILQSLGYEVHCAANMHEQHHEGETQVMEQMGVIMHHISVARSPYLYHDNRMALAQLLLLIEKLDIRVLHCHTPVGGVLGRLAGRLSKRPLYVLYTAHGFHFYKGAPLLNNTLYYLAERALAAHTDVLITINEEDHARARQLKLKPGGSVWLIPGVGLDMAHFTVMGPHERLRCRRALQVDAHCFLAVSAGELNGNKNHEAVLHMFAQLKAQRWDMRDVRYLICGEGPFARRLQDMIQACGLQDNVRLLGHVSDIRSIVGCADVFLFPSRREGLGMAALEALSMGIPVIAADNRGTREYMSNALNGWLCAPQKLSEQMGEALKKLRAMPAAERGQLRKRCVISVWQYEKRHTHRIMQEIYERMDRDVWK